MLLLTWINKLQYSCVDIYSVLCLDHWTTTVSTLLYHVQVMIIAHIPPGDADNLAEYGEFYLNMTKQFSGTIVGHLFGHTHMDQFQLVKKQSLVEL